MSHQTVIEPFRINSVEPIKFTTRGERAAAWPGRDTTSSVCTPRMC
jgi:hypothetical protein